ncbi:MAG: VCBS repeat-containing protein, partial [Proteobacteria bacterium]|nr:VCBS repeat-containing protein [Pseudomonadota bacterium]
LVTEASIALHLGGLREPLRIPAKKNGIQAIRALDYDNDGWLDLVGWGTDGLRIWRNRGRRGFHEMTEALGLKTLAASAMSHAAFADFDQDGDIDCLVESRGSGVRFLRNDGANANGLVKFRPIGNRSNFSGIGLRIELNAGNWRALRSVQRKPVEIGVGRHKDIETVIARWADTQPLFGVSANPRQVVDLIEPKNPTGSCPYLYAWDGTRFRFLTDILSSAPVGLPSRPGHNIVADPREWVSLGGPSEFVPKDGRYTVQLTEELREILYLDEARLGWVDVPAGAEAHSTSKLVPGPPFPKHELRILSGRIPLRSAHSGEGSDLTTTLDHEDGQRFSPRLRSPQLRGLAESTSIILDFGPLTDRPGLTLALSGWLRFGGGMANIAGSHDPELPFPFPRLEAETAPDHWQPLNQVVVGVPAGRTKTIVVPLGGHLPSNTRRLRLTHAFELHWDRIALFQDNQAAEVGTLRPSATDLHWHGYGEFAAMGPSDPLTPLHDTVRQRPAWRITPSGWATRYGPVDELVAAEDNGVVTVAAGDELTLEFAAKALPGVVAGLQRRFFLWTVGWNKDRNPAPPSPATPCTSASTPVGWAPSTTNAPPRTGSKRKQADEPEGTSACGIRSLLNRWRGRSDLGFDPNPNPNPNPNPKSATDTRQRPGSLSPDPETGDRRGFSGFHRAQLHRLNAHALLLEPLDACGDLRGGPFDLQTDDADHIGHAGLPDAGHQFELMAELPDDRRLDALGRIRQPEAGGGVGRIGLFPNRLGSLGRFGSPGAALAGGLGLGRFGGLGRHGDGWNAVTGEADQPPAMAGMILISSPSLMTVA